jgi:hypothetical protein
MEYFVPSWCVPVEVDFSQLLELLSFCFSESLLGSRVCVGFSSSSSCFSDRRFILSRPVGRYCYRSCRW